MKNAVLSILFIIIFIAGCDEKFLGYNYEAPALIKATRIQGNLSDKYSNKPIHPATININGQETMTDENGYYLLNYIVPDDIDPNQQEIGYISITAPDYLHYNSTLIIYPIENILNIELEYAPPIIISAISQGDTTQAIVKDYQGVEDINYVSVTFLEDTGFGIWVRKEFEMTKMSNIDINTAYYEFIAWEELINVSNISDWFRITARDKSDNVHRVDYIINPDSTLFF